LADDPALERVIAALDASFDASLARREDEAASDLAFSFLQGRSLVDAVRGGPIEVWLSGGTRLPVASVGRDFVAAGVLLVPLRRAVLHSVPGPGAPPGRSDSLLEVLRGWARSGAEVEVSSTSGLVGGRLACAAADHLELRATSARWIVGMDAVDWIRCVRGGPGDDF
jgi:hypothetical protein